ncbi:MAG: hypothetical protein Q7U74_02845 [Saprospiraceae bacterium]|nr:hypothetical protein [Saprospiraceae bacterium]
MNFSRAASAALLPSSFAAGAGAGAGVFAASAAFDTAASGFTTFFAHDAVNINPGTINNIAKITQYFLFILLPPFN